MACEWHAGVIGSSARAATASRAGVNDRTIPEFFVTVVEPGYRIGAVSVSGVTALDVRVRVHTCSHASLLALMLHFAYGFLYTLLLTNREKKGPRMCKTKRAPPRRSPYAHIWAHDCGLSWGVGGGSHDRVDSLRLPCPLVVSSNSRRNGYTTVNSHRLMHVRTNLSSRHRLMPCYRVMQHVRRDEPCDDHHHKHSL
jgi:hypothetical protein